MDKRTRIIIIVGCIVTFIIVPAVTVFLLSKSTTNQQSKDTSKVDESPKKQLPNRSDSELLKAIANNKSDELTDNGTPIFGIKSVARPAAGWYVVTIHLLDDPQGTNPAKMLLQDDGSSLSVLLGPGTSFPVETTQSIGVPDVVAEELNK